MKLFILSLSVLLLYANNALACSCQGEETTSQAYNHAALVVSGKVLKKTRVHLAESMNPKKFSSVKNKLDEGSKNLLNLEIYELEIQVTKTFKGNVKLNKVTVFTPAQSASCGFTRFEEGASFIIYGADESIIYALLHLEKQQRLGLEKSDTYWTNHCTRTVEENVAELKELNKIVSKKK